MIDPRTGTARCSENMAGGADNLMRTTRMSLGKIGESRSGRNTLSPNAGIRAGAVAGTAICSGCCAGMQRRCLFMTTSAVRGITCHRCRVCARGSSHGMAAEAGGISAGGHYSGIVGVVGHRMAAGYLHGAVDVLGLVDKDVGVGGSRSIDVRMAVAG